MKLFIDTWAWVTLINRREPRHKEVKEFYEDFRQRKGLFYTTDYVLDETITLIFLNLPFNIAVEGIEQIEQAIDSGYLHLEWIDEKRFHKAKEHRLKFQDKPRISFTDFTSMVVMQELELTDILTSDSHFTHVGMGFRILP